MLAAVRLTSVAVFGDSHGEGLERYLRAGLPIVHYDARRGRRLTTQLSNATVAPIASPPDLILFIGGGNDAQFMSRRLSAEAELSALFATVKRRFPGSRILVVGPLASDNAEVRRKHEAARRSIQAVAAQSGVGFFDTWELTERLEKHDGVHLRMSGYETLARAIVSAVGGGRQIPAASQPPSHGASMSASTSTSTSMSTSASSAVRLPSVGVPSDSPTLSWGVILAVALAVPVGFLLVSRWR